MKVFIGFDFEVFVALGEDYVEYSVKLDFVEGGDCALGGNYFSVSVCFGCVVIRRVGDVIATVNEGCACEKDCDEWEVDFHSYWF